MFVNCRRCWVWVVVAIAVSAAWSSVYGAEIRVGPNGDEIVLEGSIERGDFEKLRSLLANGEFGPDLFLASPGGDVVEAIKIGRLIRLLKLGTVVPTRAPGSEITSGLIRRHGLTDSKNFICASACFFVFVAGIERRQDFIGSPILGIHRPYLSKDDLVGLTSDQAMSVVGASRRIVEAYLRDMSVPAKYVDEMFSIGSDEIKWIGADDFGTDFEGFIAELRDWVDAQCDKRTKEEKTIWNMLVNKTGVTRTSAEKVMQDALLRKYSEQRKCEAELRETLALRAYHELLAISPSLVSPTK
jgi:hypothetical protein